MIEIRKAAIEDAASIIEHWHAMRPKMNIDEDEPFYSLEEERDIISQGNKWGIMLVALDGDRIIGICTAKRVERKAFSHNARVGCAILPKYHGQGIGTRFLKMLQEEAPCCNIFRLEIISYMSNAYARKLFYECGWTPEGVMKNYARQGDKFVDVMLLGWYADTGNDT